MTDCPPKHHQKHQAHLAALDAVLTAMIRRFRVSVEHALLWVLHFRDPSLTPIRMIQAVQGEAVLAYLSAIPNDTSERITSVKRAEALLVAAARIATMEAGKKSSACGGWR